MCGVSGDWAVVAWGPGGGLGCGCLGACVVMASRRAWVVAVSGGLDNGGMKLLESGSEAWVLVSRGF